MTPSNRLDPFDTVRYNSDIAPDTRTLHTSLEQKFFDTYQVWEGGVSYHPRKGKINARAGLFDYLTLGFSRLALLAFNATRGFTDKHQQQLWNKQQTPGQRLLSGFLLTTTLIPFALALIFHGLLNIIARPLVSALATVIFSPFVVASHLIAKTIAYFLAKQLATSNIENIVTIQDDPQQSTESSSNVVMQTLLTTQKASLVHLHFERDGAEKVNLKSNHNNVVVATINYAEHKRFLDKLAIFNPEARKLTTTPADMQPRHGRTNNFPV